MKGGKRPLGYTIIEVMIVLAVSGVMFIIAASFISGKESSSAFTEGTNEFASQLQTIITQVVNGQYSDVAFTCSASVAGVLTFNKIVLGPGVNSNQGTNSSCDFLGKFTHFSFSGNQSDYEVFSLAGARTDNTLNSATPILGGGVDLTTEQAVPQSLKVTKVTVTDSLGNSHITYGMGFVQSQGNCDTEGNCATSAQTVYMVYAPGLGANENEGQAKTTLTGGLSVAKSAVICLSDGTRYAQVTLGDSNDNASPLTANVNVVTVPC